MATLQYSHEAYCLDSLHHRFYWRDDFEGDSIKDEWTQTITGTATAAVLDGVDGGAVRLQTLANGDQIKLDWTNESLHPNLLTAFECRYRQDSYASGRYNYMGLYKSAVTRILRFYVNPGSPAQLAFRVHDVNGQNNQDTGIDPIADQWYVLRFEVHSPELYQTQVGGHVHFYVDGLECENSPQDCYFQGVPGTTRTHQPFCTLYTNQNVTTNLDLDYMEVKELRYPEHS